MFGWVGNALSIELARVFSNVGASITSSGGKTIPSPTNKHRYRIVWNNSGEKVYLAGEALEHNQGWFEYSIDGAAWSRLTTQTLQISMERFGLFLKKWSSTGTNELKVDYLRLYAITPDDENTSDQIDKSGAEDQAVIPTVGGPSAHRAPAGQGAGLRVPGPPDTQTARSAGHIGPFDKSGAEDGYTLPSAGGLRPRHTFPEIGKGATMPVVALKAGLADALTYVLGNEPEFSSATNGSNGRPHFLFNQAVKAVYYNATGEPWATPTLNNFTGYARNGYKYTNGVQDGGPVQAPWAAEAAGNYRGARDDFPVKSLLVLTSRELIIFDLDTFDGTVSSLNMWMRFICNTTTASFFLVPNENNFVSDFQISNGAIYFTTHYASISGTSRGRLHSIDFKATGQDFYSMIGSDDDWIGTAGRDITDRNTTGSFTTAGAPGHRIQSEDPQSIAVHRDGSAIWVAVGGEDRGPNLVRYLGNTSQEVVEASGTARGVGDYRKVFFDEQGWFWFAIGNRVFRNVDDFKSGVVVAELGDARHASVLLPDRPTHLAQTRNYIYVGTTSGIFRIHKGTLAYTLAYTASGGGGSGRLDTPAAGELLPGTSSEIAGLAALSLVVASYLAIAVQFTADDVGSVVLLRIYDDDIIESHVYPSLAEPGAFFNVVTTE
jgi:hypothetical protein